MLHPRPVVLVWLVSLDHIGRDLQAKQWKGENMGGRVVLLELSTASGGKWVVYRYLVMGWAELPVTREGIWFLAFSSLLPTASDERLVYFLDNCFTCDRLLCDVGLWTTNLCRYRWQYIPYCIHALCWYESLTFGVVDDILCSITVQLQFLQPLLFSLFSSTSMTWYDAWGDEVWDCAEYCVVMKHDLCN